MQVRPAEKFESRGRYSQGLLGNDIHGIEDLYRANGFEQIKIVGNVVDDYQGRENDLVLKISVDEGPQTLVGDFHMEGNQAFSEDQLNAYLNTAKGQPFSEFNIAQDRDNLLNYYFNRGFPSASFEAAAKLDSRPTQSNGCDFQDSGRATGFRGPGICVRTEFHQAVCGAT